MTVAGAVRRPARAPLRANVGGRVGTAACRPAEARHRHRAGSQGPSHPDRTTFLERAAGAPRPGPATRAPLRGARGPRATCSRPWARAARRHHMPAPGRERAVQWYGRAASATPSREVGRPGGSRSAACGCRSRRRALRSGAGTAARRGPGYGQRPQPYHRRVAPPRGRGHAGTRGARGTALPRDRSHGSEPRGRRWARPTGRSSPSRAGCTHGNSGPGGRQRGRGRFRRRPLTSSPPPWPWL